MTFRAVLIDYDEELFTPPVWIGDEFGRYHMEWTEGRFRTPEAALAAAREGDVVLIQSARPLLDRSLISQLERCRCIIRLGVGYDNIDLAAATERGIPVCNVPAYCTEDVADHALALMLNCVRQIGYQDRRIRAGFWDRSVARPNRPLRGSCLGIIGLGRIGRALARRVSGLGMTLLVDDPYVDAETIAGYGGQKVTLEELLVRADIISIHCLLNEETYHLLGPAEFARMKQGVFIVNTSRGPVIDEAALAEALERGQVWGAGLDVLEREPLPVDSPLRRFENLTFTPHSAASSEESLANVYRTGREIAMAVAEGRRPPEVVNPEVKVWWMAPGS